MSGSNLLDTDLTMLEEYEELPPDLGVREPRNPTLPGLDDGEQLELPFEEDEDLELIGV